MPNISDLLATNTGNITANAALAASAGAYEVVSDAAYTSGSSAIDFTVEPDYFYTLEFMGVGSANGGAHLQVAFSHNAFSNTNNVQWWTRRQDIWGQDEATQKGSDANWYYDAFGKLSRGNISGSSDDQSVHGQLFFAQKTGDYPFYYGKMNLPTNANIHSNYPQTMEYCGRVMSTNSQNRLRFYVNSGNIVATRIRLLRRS